MSGNGILGGDIPLIGAKPKIRIEKVFVDALKLNDADGEAELQPQEDITMGELYKLTLLLIWVIGTPPVPQGDPQTGGKTPLIRALQWRQFVADEQLERHFAFRMRADQRTEGTA